MDPLLFYVNTGAPISSITGMALTSNIHCVDRKTIRMIEALLDLQLGETLIRSKGVVKLFLRTFGQTQDTSILLAVVYVNIPDILGLGVIDGTSLLVDNIK